jgi:ribosomal protein L31
MLPGNARVANAILAEKRALLPVCQKGHSFYYGSLKRNDSGQMKL